MRKLTIVLLVILMTSLTVLMLFYSHPDAREMMTGFAVRVIAILSMLKVKVLITGLVMSFKKFFLGLTLFKILGLGIKRYLMDHVISKGLKDHFFVHLGEPLKAFWQCFDLKKKILFFIPASIVAGFGVYIAGIGKLLNILGIKTLVIGFFKGLWIVLAKVFFFFSTTLWNSWFAPILQIFLFSWILSLIEKIPLVKKLGTKLFGRTHYWLRRLSYMLHLYLHRPVRKRLNHAGKVTAKIIVEKNQKIIEKKRQRLR